MFITFEGPDGSGKTSQVAPLVDFLCKQGYNVLATREPGGTSIGDQIRAILSNLENTEMHPRTEILLFCSSRAQLVEQIIRPYLLSGGIVICDRFADSTLAYQGYGHGVDLDTLRYLLKFATDNLKPDLTILFDIDAEAGLRRRKINGSEWNRLDAYHLAFHQRVHHGYHELAKSEPQRWRIIDASQKQDVIQSVLRQIILQKIADTR
jgi:dTMP kinase